MSGYVHNMAYNEFTMILRLGTFVQLSLVCHLF